MNTAGDNGAVDAAVALAAATDIQSLPRPHHCVLWITDTRHCTPLWQPRRCHVQSHQTRPQQKMEQIITVSRKVNLKSIFLRKVMETIFEILFLRILLKYRKSTKV